MGPSCPSLLHTSLSPYFLECRAFLAWPVFSLFVSLCCAAFPCLPILRSKLSLFSFCPFLYRFHTVVTPICPCLEPALFQGVLGLYLLPRFRAARFRCLCPFRCRSFLFSAPLLAVAHSLRAWSIPARRSPPSFISAPSGSLTSALRSPLVPSLACIPSPSLCARSQRLYSVGSLRCIQFWRRESELACVFACFFVRSIRRSCTIDFLSFGIFLGSPLHALSLRPLLRAFFPVCFSASFSRHSPSPPVF